MKNLKSYISIVAITGIIIGSFGFASPVMAQSASYTQAEAAYQTAVTAETADQAAISQEAKNGTDQTASRNKSATDANAELAAANAALAAAASDNNQTEIATATSQVTQAKVVGGLDTSAATVANNQPKGNYCTITTLPTCINVAITTVMTLGGNLVLSFCGIFLWIAGLILNLAVTVTVVNMKANLAPLLPSITLAWKIFRDFINMLFIFILLYTAVATILNVGGDWRKVVGHLILVAIFINFSLFMTEVLIDASNLASYGFYNAIQVSPATNAASGVNLSSTGIFTVTGANMGISGAIMQRLDLTQIYNIGAPGSGSSILSNIGNSLVATLGGSVFIVVAAFVFLVMAFLLIIRFVILIFLLIFSPFAFIGWIGIPMLKRYGQMWWDKLIDNLLFAPAMMLMLWISLQLLGGISSLAGASSGSFIPTAAAVATTGAAAATSPVATMFNFILLIIFMIASIIVAKKAGASGGDFATKWAGKATFGAVAKIGQQTIGRASSAISNRDDLRNAASKKGFGGFVARRALDTTRFGANASYDARNTAAGKAGDLGKPGKTESLGYDKWLKEKTASEQRDNALYDASKEQKDKAKAVGIATQKTAKTSVEDGIKSARGEATVNARQNPETADVMRKLSYSNDGLREQDRQIKNLEKNIQKNIVSGNLAANPELEKQLAIAKETRDGTAQDIKAYSAIVDKATNDEFAKVITRQSAEGDEIAQAVQTAGLKDDSGNYKDQAAITKQAADVQFRTLAARAAVMKKDMTAEEKEVVKAVQIAGIKDSSGQFVPGVRSRRDRHADVIENNPFMFYNKTASKEMAKKVREDVAKDKKGGTKNVEGQIKDLLQGILGEDTKLADVANKKPGGGFSGGDEKDDIHGKAATDVENG